jgi:DNA-binding NarL/FixJ family response regulator
MSSIKIVLLIEDSPGDARLLGEMLSEKGSFDTELVHVTCMSEAEARLAAGAFDVILLDLGLPDAQGLEAIRRIHAVAPRVPLVVLTGLDDKLLAVQALQEGAQDYLIKGQIEIRGLLRALRYAIERKIMESAALAMAQRMAHSAEHDFLTGLPNRMLLNDRISQAIALATRHMTKVAVLFLDLDDGMQAGSPRIVLFCRAIIRKKAGDLRSPVTKALRDIGSDDAIEFAAPKLLGQGITIRNLRDFQILRQSDRPQSRHPRPIETPCAPHHFLRKHLVLIGKKATHPDCAGHPIVGNTEGTSPQIPGCRNVSVGAYVETGVPEGAREKYRQADNVGGAVRKAYQVRAAG